MTLKMAAAILVTIIFGFSIGMLYTVFNENLYVVWDQPGQLVFQPFIFVGGCAILGVIFSRAEQISAKIRGITTIGLMAIVLGIISPGFLFNTWLLQGIGLISFGFCCIFAKDRKPARSKRS